MTARRNTIQRKVILEELQNSRLHLTATELHKIVQQRLPQISLGTIYRNLDLLKQDGRIRKLQIVGRETRFDGVVEVHYHLRCYHCGRIDDIHGPVSVRVEGEILSSSGWHVADPQVEFFGVCPDCHGSASPSSPNG